MFIGLLSFSCAGVAEQETKIGEYYDELNSVKMDKRLLDAKAELLQSQQKVSSLETAKTLTEIETRIKLSNINKKLEGAGFATDGNDPQNVVAPKALTSKPSPPPVPNFNESNVHFLAIRGDSRDSLSALVRVGAKENWVLLGGEVIEGWSLLEINSSNIYLGSRDGQSKIIPIKGIGE